ncbi:MAG: hypothetical protein E7351_03030 [Clostridiales bacterium]|nr:hypothetical protein [Clostridiales bacterium]
MKDLVYPAVVYKDQNGDGFTIGIHDLGIFTDGATVVDAYIEAKKYLCAMVDCAIKFDCDINAPSDFDEVWNDNHKGKKKNIVLLIDALAS